MAATQIADIYEPLAFGEIIDEKATELNAFIQSGIVVEDATVSGLASTGGRIGELPNFAPLDVTNEPNVSSDDPTSFSTPEKIASQKQIYRLAALNNSWSNMDLARELALSDPADAITTKIAQYWATQQQRRVVQSAMGVLADNVANDAGDMVVNIATDDAGAITADELISPDAVIDARLTSGDHMFNFTVIAMNSTVYGTLEKQQVIDFIPPANSAIPVPYYLGMRVVIDDGMPAVAGTNRTVYTSVLFGAGAIAHGSGMVLNPSEYERLPSAGDGGGQEVIYSRTSDIIHPWGESFLSTSVAAESATLAELADATNWDRIYERKNINMAFLQTNG